MRETTTTFTSLDPNRKIEVEARIGPLRPKGVMTFGQAEGGTTVMVRLDPNPVGPFKLISPLFTRFGRKVWDERLARIKAALEAPTP